MQLLYWDKSQAFHFHDSTFGGCSPSLPLPSTALGTCQWLWQNIDMAEIKLGNEGYTAFL